MGDVLISGDASLRAQAFDLLEQMEGPPAVEAPEPEAGALVEIAELYAKAGLHPRAWEILRQFREVVGADVAAKLEEQYKKEWLDLLKKHFAGVDKPTLFGQSAATIGERLAIKIPVPQSKEALERAAMKVKDLLQRERCRSPRTSMPTAHTASCHPHT